MELEIEQRTVLIAGDEELDALDQLAAVDPSRPGARGGAERAAVDHHRRGQDLVAAGEAPVEGQALAQPAPQPEPGPAGEARVQRREGNARKQPGDAPLHAPEGQHPDQPDHAPPQGKIRLAPAAMHPNPLAVHGLQLRLDREDEHLHIGQGIPAVTAAGPGNRTDGRRRQISGAQEAGVRHRPHMVRRGQRTDLYVGTDIMKRVIPRTDSYVKPFVKRQKNDVADAEAICEAAQRPGMRFVPVKEEAQQANAVVFRVRDLLVRQRTQCINALRGHLAEYGHVVPQGPAHVDSLVALVDDPKSSVPESARGILQVLIRTLNALEEQLKELDGEIARRAKADPVARRLMTIPGIGPIAATAITALVPAPEGFRAGRDFAAWLGLTPLQKSTGGKHKLGAISKRGERTIRRLLILGASAVVRWAGRRGAAAGSWLARMLARKPRMLVTTALANKTARIVWALLVKGGTYGVPAVAA